MKIAHFSTALFWKDVSFALLLVVYWLLMFLGDSLENIGGLLEDLVDNSTGIEEREWKIAYAVIAVLILSGIISLRTIFKKDGETKVTSGVIMLVVVLLHTYLAIRLLDGLYFFGNFAN